MQKLLDAVTENIEGEAIGGASLSRFPTKTVFVWGTFDGATVTIEISPDGVEWFDAPNSDGDPLEFTAKGVENIDVQCAYIRAVVTNAGASTEVSAAVG